MDKKLIFLISFLLALSFLSYAQVPQMINYQGMLSDAGGNPISGDYSVVFKIYSAETGGTVLWSETQTVTVTDGLFDVLLGSTTAIQYSVFDGGDKYLALKIGSDSEMSPRKRLVSVGYSLHAYNSDKFGGKDTSEFVFKLDGVSPNNGNVDLIAGDNVTITPDAGNHNITIAATASAGGDNLGNHTATENVKLNNHWLSGDGGNEGVFVNSDGKVGIGTTTPEAILYIKSHGGAGGQIIIENTITAGNKLSIGPGDDPIHMNHQAWFGAPYGNGGIDAYAYGTMFGFDGQTQFAHQIRFANNSLMTVKTDGKVGIGTTNPAEKLDVVGTAKMTGFKMPTDANDGYVLTSDANGNGTWSPVASGADNDWTIAGNNMYSAVSGNVGIGSSTPSRKLYVAGEGEFTGDLYARNEIVAKGSTYPAKTLTMRSVSAQTLDATDDLYVVYGSATGAAGIVFKENATERMRIHTGGKVGIGTSNPAQKLHVNGTVQMSGFKMSNGASNGYVLTSNSSGVGTWQAAGGADNLGNHTATQNLKLNGHWLSNDGGNEGVFVKTNGDVGINTDSPSKKLEVKGDIRARSNSYSNRYIQLESGSYQDLVATNDLMVRYGDTFGSGAIVFKEAGTERMRIAHGGNVGIGDSSPSYKLTVDGGADFDGDVYAKNEFIARGSSYPSRTLRMKSVSGQYLIATNDLYINCGTESGSPGTIVFQENGSERMRIKTGGNVGIGTSSPGNILTIKHYSSTDPIADSWTTYSSRRWKTNIKPIDNALNLVSRLTGVSYDWKENSKHDIGLIAEDVGKVIPEIVAYEDNGVDAKSVDYSRLVAVLIQGMKEQQAKIEKLEKRILILEKEKR